MIYSRIVGTGSALPIRVVTNAEIEKRVETTDEWIVERSGIRERRILSPGEDLTSLAAQASLLALDMAGLLPSVIDMIILATTTPDQIFPSTAVLLQQRLGISGCPAFDVSAACAGFNYGLGIADAFIRSSQAKTILILGAEALSRIVDPTDRTTCFLFGDGVGAVLLQASTSPGVIGTKLHAAGEYKELLYAPSSFGDKEILPRVVMSGNAVFKVAVTTLEEAVIEILHENGMTQSQVDWLIPHQANLRIIKAVAKRLDLPMEKVIVNIEKYGNTSSASVPIALDDAIRGGQIKSGEILLLESFGGGFTWGSALIKY